MIENARRYLGQRLGSIGIVIALTGLAVLAALPLASGQPSGFTATLAVFVMTSGIISRDAASGALQMILSRPILRAEYLLGRFLGAVTLFAGFVATAIALGLLLDRAATLAGWVSGGPAFAWKSALVAGLTDFVHGTLIIAILLFFSTFLRGMGDVLAFALIGLVLNLLPQIGTSLHKPALSRAAAVLMDNLSPTLPLSGVLPGHPLLPATGAYVLALVSYVLAACVIFNRREFSYGSD